LNLQGERLPFEFGQREKNYVTKILLISIVEDDESFRRATTRLVRSLGYAVAAFGSAEEFLNSGRLNDTVCLISDVHMPGMSGIELQKHLLAQGYRLPVVFISAYPEPAARGQSLASGTLGFLSKPFSEEKLISYLGQALADSKA
jgi:FixJ family two-component response regulator